MLKLEATVVGCGSDDGVDAVMVVVMVDPNAGARIGMRACCSIHVLSCWHNDA